MFLENKSDFKILTNDSYKEFKGIQKIFKDAIEFTFDNGTSITTSLNHRFMFDGIELFASSLSVGDTILDADNEPIKILNIQHTENIELFDIVGVENENFIANNIIHHNCEFLGSTYTVIDAECLKYLFEKTTADRPIAMELSDNLKIFEFPENNALYIIGCDPAKGSGKHAATIQILKILEFDPNIKAKQVAVFSSNSTDTYALAQIINRLSIYYNNAQIICESNGEGSAVVTHIWWTFQNPYLYNEKNKGTLGVVASHGSKTRAILMMKRLLEKNMLELCDFQTVNQLATYIEDESGRMHGQNGMPDDLVSSLYWVCYAFAIPSFFEDAINVYDKNSNDDDVWGILSDINDNVEFEYMYTL